MLNFNVDPYYDDFDPNNNYHRILFRPGRAVQARELTQSQTILQKQVDSVQNELKNTVLGVANLSDNVYNLNPSLLTKSTPSKLKQVEATINAELLKQLIANLEIAKMNCQISYNNYQSHKIIFQSWYGK